MKFGGWATTLLLAGFLVLLGYYSSVVVAETEPLTIRLFELFKDKTLPLMLAVGMLSAALAILIGYYGFVVKPVLFQIRKEEKFLRKYRDEENFAENFDIISERLSKNPIVGHSWREFSETLVVPNENVTIVQNTVRPQFFINSSNAHEKSRALKLMPHIPNYFVGIGLLLTFIGLVAALFFANKTVGGDITQAVDGLKDLLAAATFKFWTSIAGLLASIVLSFFFRIFNLSIDEKFSLLCRSIESQMHFVTPQRIFFDVRDTIAEQLSETKKINTEVAMAIAEGVGQKLQEHVPTLLADAMQPLVNAVVESSRKVGEGATDGLGNMVDQFAKTIEGTAGNHMREMTTTLQQLQVSLSGMDGVMNSSGDEFAKRMTEGSERLDATMREVATAMREVVDSLKVEVGSAANGFGDNLQKSISQLSDQTAQIVKDISENSRTASTAFAGEINAAAVHLKDSADENARQSVEFSEKLRENLNDGVSSVQGGLDKLGKTLETLGGQLAVQGSELDNVSDKSRDAARAMETAAQGVRTGLVPFQALAGSIEESGRRMEATVTTVGENIASASDAVGGIASGLQGVLSSLESSWQNYQTRFETVDEDLEKTFTQLHQAVERQQSQVVEFVRQLDSSFEKALSGLAGGIDGINDGVENLTDALDDIGKKRSMGVAGE